MSAHLVDQGSDQNGPHGHRCLRILRYITDAVGNRCRPRSCTTSCTSGSHDHRYSAMKRPDLRFLVQLARQQGDGWAAPDFGSRCRFASACRMRRQSGAAAGRTDRVGCRRGSTAPHRLPPPRGESGPAERTNCCHQRGVGDSSPVGRLRLCPQLGGGRRRRSPNRSTIRWLLPAW